MNRIFLIGYMGSGKTTIGKLLAKKLGYEFVDMDVHIEAKQFKSISQIFAEKGEDEFRKMEQDCLHEVGEFENVIISTGGGVPCFFDNIDYMNSHGTTIYLKLTANELAERLELVGTNKRPVLAGKNGAELRQSIEAGLAKRESFYEKASHSVSGSIEDTVNHIYEMVVS